jgi:hypothetical protein
MDFKRFRTQICLCSLWHCGTQFFIIFHSLIQCILVAKIRSVLQLTTLFNSLWSPCFGCQNMLTLPSNRKCAALIVCLELLSSHLFPQTTSVLHSSFAWNSCQVTITTSVLPLHISSCHPLDDPISSSTSMTRSSHSQTLISFWPFLFLVVT